MEETHVREDDICKPSWEKSDPAESPSIDDDEKKSDDAERKAHDDDRTRGKVNTGNAKENNFDVKNVNNADAKQDTRDIDSTNENDVDATDTDQVHENDAKRNKSKIEQKNGDTGNEIKTNNGDEKQVDIDENKVNNGDEKKINNSGEQKMNNSDEVKVNHADEKKLNETDEEDTNSDDEKQIKTTRKKKLNRTDEKDRNSSDEKTSKKLISNEKRTNNDGQKVKSISEKESNDVNECTANEKGAKTSRSVEEDEINDVEETNKADEKRLNKKVGNIVNETNRESEKSVSKVRKKSANHLAKRNSVAEKETNNGNEKEKKNIERKSANRMVKRDQREASKDSTDEDKKPETGDEMKVVDETEAPVSGDAIDDRKPRRASREETRRTDHKRDASLGVKDAKSSGEEFDDEKQSIKDKRKRKISSLRTRDSSGEVIKESNKPKRPKNESDKFCWRCHKEAVDSQCTACPRSWHRRCIGAGTQPSLQNWICGECATILKAENAETRSPVMAQITVDQLCTLLKHIVDRMRDYPGSEPFWKAVDLNEVPNYLDYVVKPMDLCLLEANVRAKLYGSTEAFMADAKWIQHNCIVFNTCGGVYADTSKLTTAARQIITTARKEVSEIEACPDCYGNARSLFRSHPSWFVEPCRRPHPLVWAKLKGFPFWPAKAMPRINGQGLVDVRFFGAHDRAWVSPRDLYLYSEEPPTPAARRRKPDMDECVVEITRHCRKLELAFGQFKFAPPKIQYNPKDPSQIKLMLPNYDPLNPTAPRTAPSPPETADPTKKKVPSKKPKKKSPELTRTTDSNSEPETAKLPPSNKSDSATSPEITSGKKPLAKRRTSDVESKKPKKKRTSSDPEGSILEEPKTPLRNSPRARDTSMETETGPSNPESMEKTEPVPLSESKAKSKPSPKRVYKPKTRMVDQVNAERAKETALNQNPVSVDASVPKGQSVAVIRTQVSNGSVDGSPKEVVAGKSLLRSAAPKAPGSTEAPMSYLLVMNNPPTKPVEQLGEPTTVIKQEPKEQSPKRKKESKARKSFPTKPPVFPQIPAASPLNGPTNPPDAMVYIPAHRTEPQTDYVLSPPEAGPLSAQLHRSGQELAKRMTQLMGEALSEAARLNTNPNDGCSDANQRATVHHLRLQIERMRWQHEQHLAELKHNTDLTLREMRATFEAERYRALEEMKREAEEERLRCVEETKRKQWCALCGNEALFYCCWNTAYCDYPCQQAHWSTHMRTCAQNPPPNAVITTSNATSQQVMPRLVITSQHASSNVWGA